MRIDLSGVLESDNFQALFCKGCPVAAKNPWDECPAAGDFMDASCRRNWLYREIEDILGEAEIAVNRLLWKAEYE